MSALNTREFFKNLQKMEVQPQAGRGHGNQAGGRGGRGRGGGGNQPQAQTPAKASPWPDPPPKPVYSEDAIKKVVELINRDQSRNIDEDDVAELPSRIGDSVLMYVLAVRGMKLCKSFKGKRDAVGQHVRYWSRKKMIEHINNPEELKRKMFGFSALTRKDDAFDHNTPPIEFTDLLDPTWLELWGEATNPEAKRPPLVGLLVEYLLRNFEESENLIEVIQTVQKTSIDYLQTIVQRRREMNKFIMKRGKGKQIRFVPLDIPEEDYTAYPYPWPPKKGDVSTKESKMEVETENPYSELMEDEELYAALEEPIPEKEKEEEQVEENTQTPLKQTQEAQPSSKEEETKSIAVFEEGLNHPSRVISLDMNRIDGLAENELKEYLIGKLRPYIYGYFSERGEELLEQIRRKNSIFIMNLINSEGKLKELAKLHSIPSVLRVEMASPNKISGSHPLASNVHRKYTIQCSKKWCKALPVEQAAMMVLEKLFIAVKCLDGDHVVKLVPFNPASSAIHYYEARSIRSDITSLPGRYLGNIRHHSWEDKLEWEVCIESSMDLAYLINMSNSRTSVQCDSINAYFKKNEIQVKILDIAVSNKQQMCVIVKSSAYDEGIECIKEISEATQHMASYVMDPAKVEIQWRSVSDPKDQNNSAMMGVILADPRIAEDLMKALISLNRPGRDAVLYPRTYDWKFYHGKEGDHQSYKIEEAIKAQIEYQQNQMNVVFTGIYGVDLMTYLPMTDAEGKDEQQSETVAQLLLKTKMFDIGPDNLWDGSPFEHIYKRSASQYMFSGPKHNQGRICRYLKDGNRFAWNMQNWLKGTKMEGRTSEIKVYLVEPDPKDPSSKPYQLPIVELENGTGRIVECQTNREKEKHHEIPLGLPPPPMILRTQEDQSVGRGENKTHEAVPMGASLQTPYPYPTWDRAETQIAAPMPTGTITIENLNHIINCLAAQLKIHIGNEIERAFRVTDPAGRLATLLNERDYRLETKLVPDIFAAVAEGQQMILEKYQETLEAKIKSASETRDREVSDVATGKPAVESTTPSKKLTKTPQTPTNPNTAPNDVDDTTGGPTPTNEMDLNCDNSKMQPQVEKAHKSDEANTSNYQTPNSSVKAIESKARELEDEMDRKKLSFDEYADGTAISPIKEGTDEETDRSLSPSTRRLKDRLNNTTDKSTWEVDESIDEKETPKGNKEGEDLEKSSLNSSNSSGLPESRFPASPEEAQGENEPSVKTGGEKEVPLAPGSPESVTTRAQALKQQAKKSKSTSQIPPSDRNLRPRDETT